MKIYRLHSVVALAATAVTCFALLRDGRAAATQPAGPGKTGAAAATNSASDEITIPLAVFNLTNGVARDPFFPNSVRHPVQPQAAAPTFSREAIILKGLSGSTAQRLALINNRTVAVGEEAEITTAAGKVKIRLLDIKEASVLLRVATLPDVVEISLRKSAQ